MVIRAAIDTNVLISALLVPESMAPPSTIVRRAIGGKFVPVISETTLSEVRDKTSHKPFLVKRLPPEVVDDFLALLRSVAVIVPAPPEPPPAATRDPKDDYLLAPEIVSLVDHLVTGDRDLLEYTGVRRNFILTAAQFLRILDDKSADLPNPGP